MNLMVKSLMKSLTKLKKNIKSIKLVRQMMVLVNKFEKITHIKPIYLLYLLGLFLVSLVILLLRGNYKEGYTTIEEINKDKKKFIDAMNCAINNSTTVTATRDKLRDHINHYLDSYMPYLDQDIMFNAKNNIDKSGNKDNKIYKIKNSSDISSTTPEYIDNDSVPSISSSDLLKYELVYIHHLYEENYIDSQGNNDKKIYKIKNDADINGTTMPKYIDNNSLLPEQAATSGTPSLENYSLIDVDVIVPISKNEIDELENYIKNTDFNINSSSKSKLELAFNDLKTYTENSFAYIDNKVINIGKSSMIDRDSYVSTVNSVLNQGSADPCNPDAPTSTSTSTPSSENTAYWKSKYETLLADIEKNKDKKDNMWKENYITELSKLMGSDMANADKWKRLYLDQLKILNEYKNYAISHNKQYHSNNKVQGQNTYESLTGWPMNSVNNAAAQGNVPSGKEDLYMLKTGMVPPSNPPGAARPSASTAGAGAPTAGAPTTPSAPTAPSAGFPSVLGALGAAGSANVNSEYNNPNPSQCNSCKPAPVPPCPPCERCPEPDFDCKRVPKYNKASGNRYLPRPILADFSQFGM